MKWNELGLNDKPVFEQYLKKYPPEVSELTFTNLFMWDHYYHFRYCIIEDCLCIIANYENKHVIFPPVGDLKKIMHSLKAVIDYFKENNWEVQLERIPEMVARQITELCPEVKLKKDRNNCDYIYRTKDLVDLRGRKYHAKKNFVNRFLRENAYETVELNGDNVHECLAFTKEWLQFKNLNMYPALIDEYKAIERALKNFDKLNIRGLVVKINNKVEAYTFGEMLNENTAVVHVEKANPQIPGLYVFINQCFCKYIWNNVKYINREQDMGIEGLRRAKLSYHPVRMVNKYRSISA